MKRLSDSRHHAVAVGMVSNVLYSVMCYIFVSVRLSGVLSTTCSLLTMRKRVHQAEMAEGNAQHETESLPAVGDGVPTDVPPREPAEPSPTFPALTGSFAPSDRSRKRMKRLFFLCSALISIAAMIATVVKRSAE